MNTSTRQGMLEKTLAHAMKYADKEGKRQRKDSARTVAKIHAANALKYFNGIIDWDPTTCPMGYATVYHHIAGEYFGAGLKPMEKAEQSNDYAGTLKQGFNSLRETMLEQHNILLYMVPRTPTNLKIEVISIDPDYVVDTITDMTVDDVAAERDSKQAQGQIRSAYTRQAKIHSKEEAKAKIMLAVNKAINDPIAGPTMKLEG